MKTSHKGMSITDADFKRAVDDLVKALDGFNVGATEKNARDMSSMRYIP